jgi:hypothetical protein
MKDTVTDGQAAVLAFACFAFGFFLAVMLVGTGVEAHSEIIKHGAGYYHPETGKFTWKEEAK